MKNPEPKFVAVLFAVMLTIGCAYYPTGDEVGVNYYGEINSSTDGFHMEGYLKVEGGAPEKPMFTDVTLYLYARNSSLLYSKKLGDLNTSHVQLDVSIDTKKSPYYVVFTSDDFWEEKVQVNYFQLDSGGTYDRMDATTRNDLPVTPES